MARAMGAVPIVSSPMAAVQVTPPEPPKADLACLVCRSRKVRCDRTLPHCRNCIRLGVSCPGYDRESESISRKEVIKMSSDIFKAAGVEKRRVGSCEECRASKHRCTKTRPSCRRCLVRKLTCVYPSKPDREDQPEQPRPAVPRRVSPPHASPGISPDFGVETDKLYSDTLPEDSALRLRLINAFFERSHPLRCLCFLHKPSFMQSFDRASVVQDYGEPLLYAMCALGARHIYFDAAASSSPPLCETKMVPGQAWAERARKEILAEIHAPTVHHLMTMLLLCDYGLRADQNAMVFVLVSFLYRTVRLLSLDNPEPLENPTNPVDILQREIENRLVWSSYFIDSLVASGVAKNSCWKDYVPGIPLPCNVKSFLAQTPSQRRYVLEIEKMGVVPVIEDLDLNSLTILVVRLRFEVLRLIRTPDIHGDIWDPSSPFLQIIQRLDAIYQNIPERYHLNDLNMYILKDNHLLGATFFFYLLVHAVVFDLTRISLAGFNFPLAAAFQRAPPEFRLQCQDRCRFHAEQVSDLIRRGMLHGRAAFDDMFCADAALESAKIQIIYAATVNRATEVVGTTRENLKTHFEFLEMFNRGKDAPSPFIRTLLPLCMLFGFRDIAQENMTASSATEDQAEVTGSADIEHLSQFAPFRRARSELKKAKSTGSAMTLSSGYTQPSPVAQPGVQPTETIETGHTEHDYSLPTMAPAYPSFTQQQPQHQQAPMVAELAPNPNQMMPPISIPLGAPTEMPMQNNVMMQAQVDDYLKAADELSNYLTWDMSQLPTWIDFGEMMPPG